MKETLPETGKLIEEHLSVCPACKSLYSEIAGTLKTVDSVKLDLPEKAWEQFAVSLRDKLYVNRFLNMLRPAMIVSTAALLFVLGYKFLLPAKPGTGMALSEAEELAYTLTDFDLPEVYQ
jgi:predicted anti-sigma-YlaC factor YlaD